MRAVTGFGGRVVISAVATMMLVIVILSSPAAARPEARGRARCPSRPVTRFRPAPDLRW
jgi:hypothetical protein